MSFKFDFSVEDNGINGDLENEVKPCSCPTELAPAIEMYLTDKIDSDVPFQDITLGDNTEITYVISSAVEQDIKEDGTEDSLKNALNQNLDLVPNVYEGGLKVWECCVDLTEYLSSCGIAFRGLKVLELGCGAGLPGLYAFLKGAEVHFQDYNKDVLERITIPNVFLNSKESDQENPHCRYFAGDWSLLQEKFLGEIKDLSEGYDIILTSETIYSQDNYKKLHDLMERVLKPSGVVYLAAKIHYFGVGGGLRDFEDHVKKWGYFTTKTCQKVTDGMQREILEMRPNI